ncbi:hypothetical protein ACVME8_002981 [Bradyrhizobium diazoefficiens]
MTNDTGVYPAVPVDPINGGKEGAGHMGTHRATIDYVNLERVRSSPRLFTL